MKNSFFLMVIFLLGINFVLAQDSPSGSSQTLSKCDTSWVAETGAFTSYIGSDVGETFHPSPVVQMWTDVEHCGNKRASVGVNFWQSLSTKSNPSSGTEFDAKIYANFKLSKDRKTNLHVETGVFVVPGAKIYIVGASISRSFKVSEKVEGEFANTFSFYRTNIQAILPGGVVNKATLSLARSFKKFSTTITPAISVDNNPFDLGPGRAAAIAHLAGRIEIPITKKVSFFVSGGMSNPIAGDTTRGFRKSAGIGLFYVFK